jgi:hypothetical protein
MENGLNQSKVGKGIRTLGSISEGENEQIQNNGCALKVLLAMRQVMYYPKSHMQHIQMFGAFECVMHA